MGLEIVVNGAHLMTVMMVPWFDAQGKTEEQLLPR